ncbi:MAG TPA: hypothetical protein DIU39_10495 [Flavobacteriales bacterium]|nr:hypothetical protein [Flavobacteriales bacterium]|tara:strand:+ start:11738 stop:13471 length:1734 start_codon:yes stop_codon:yes gene_type:complete
MTFSELGLSNEVLQAIHDLGYENPTPIQEKSIPALLETDRDYVGLAQTGTGKTAAFGIPLLETIEPFAKTPQAIILSPTRELALQITNELKNFAKYKEGINIVTVYGGADIRKQINQLKSGAEIVVGTPGRTVDLIKRRALNLSEVNTVVLDEADEMLNMGFKDDMDTILEQTPEDKRVWLFSATMPKEVERIAKNYMTDPFKVVVGKQNSSNENIEHQYAFVKAKDFYFALKRFIDYYPDMFGMVFCKTRRDTKEVADRLMQDGYDADALHGDLSQAQRDHVMKKFRNKHLQILVATDVAARGIDVDDITHVFNYHLPEDIESYTHRSGRTARAGKKGIAISLVHPRDAYKIKQVERQINKKMKLVKVPTGEVIVEKQIYHFIDSVHNTEVDETLIDDYLPKVFKELEEFSKDEIIKKMVMAEVSKYLKAYEHARDLNAKPGKRDMEESSVKGDRRGRDANKKRIFINVGRNDGIREKGGILRFVCDASGIAGKNIGRIDLLDNMSFVDVDAEYGDRVVALNGEDFEGKTLRVEYSKGKDSSDRGGRRQTRNHRSGNRRRTRSNNSKENYNERSFF